MNSKLRLVTLSLSLSLGLGACQPAETNDTGAGGTSPAGGRGGTTSTGSAGTTGAAGTTGQAGTTGSGGATATAGTSGRGGSAGAAGPGVAGSSGGTTALGGRGGVGGSGVAGTTGSAGQGGAAHVRDHCIDGYAPDPADETMMDGPVNFTKNGQTDTTVQNAVIAWMTAHAWQSAHFQWHNIRRCTGGMVDRTRDGNLDPCKFTDLVPANQEGRGAGDGLEFFAMHRHMIQSLKQLFPKHTEQFEGWNNFPTMRTEMPMAWQNDWTAFQSRDLMNGMRADNPAANISMWATEGDFGQWIQTTSGLHGALHFKWVRTQNQDHGLGNQFTNIDNYMFWKMHGWIDKVWDKYRAAKGKTPNDQDIKDAVLKQCREMDQLAILVKPSLNTDPGTCTPAPAQSGEFVEKIRPIFENTRNNCTGCHGTGAQAGLTLGGSPCVKSSDIVAALLKQSKGGGQFKLIVPGNADQSWLYRKVAGTAAAAGCVRTNGVDCNTTTMPMGGGVTLTTAELDALKTWINNGAPAPQ